MKKKVWRPYLDAGTENSDIGRAHTRHTGVDTEKGFYDINTEHKETFSHH